MYSVGRHYSLHIEIALSLPTVTVSTNLVIASVLALAMVAGLGELHSNETGKCEFLPSITRRPILS